MHRVIESHLNSFVEQYDFTGLKTSEQFERFCNLSILSSKVASAFDVEEVTTNADDDGIDGIAILIDEEIVFCDDDAITIFKKDRRNIEVELVFVQAKTSESFDLGDFLKFKEGILAFLSSDFKPNSDLLKESSSIFNTCVKSITKIRDAGIVLSINYVTTGQYHQPKELEAAKTKFFAELKDTGLFQKIDINFIGREELVKYWRSTFSSMAAQLPIISSIPLPNMSGVDEAYIILAKAKDVVEKLLKHENGSLKSQVFEENVRSFLGNENAVNKAISVTLRDVDLSSRFPVLNNGITIVSPKVRVQGTVLHLEDYQIVNGCQTSNLLFENRASLNSVSVVRLKIVATQNEDVFADIVKATNSQTKVDDSQFYSLKPIVKKVEAYFKTYDESASSYLYFERREHQYSSKSIKVARVFDVKTTAQAVGAMFLMRPDLAGRYAKQMYQDIGPEIFDEKNKETVFYCAALALYHVHNLVSNADIPQNMRQYKWHILALLRASLTKKEVVKLNSRQVEKDCSKIITILSSGDKAKIIAAYKRPVDIIQSLGGVTRDRLKRQLVLKEMLSLL